MINPVLNRIIAALIEENAFQVPTRFSTNLDVQSISDKLNLTKDAAVYRNISETLSPERKAEIL